MENFFVDENFFLDIGDFVDHYDLQEDDVIQSLPRDWEQKIELTTLEPMFQIDENFIIDSIFEQILNKYEERLPMEDDVTDNKIKCAIRNSVDVKKINDMIPKLYYPSGKFETITKQDLLDNI